jgi:ATP-dependent RNA circularization protein (DNA/RNA ligase family)
MNEYHKIQTIFKRDMSNRGKIIIGEYSLPEFEYLKDNDWVFTEKVDGTNIRVMWDGANVTFGGKTDNAQMPVFLLYKLQELFEGTAKKQLFKEKFNSPQSEPGSEQVCLYGEGYGAKIQKGGANYIKDGVDFVLFDVKIGDWWLQRKDVEDIANHFGIRVVPILGTGTIDEAIAQVRMGFPSQWGDFTAEGLVLRPATELKTRRGDRIITKIKHIDFS